LLDGFVPFGAVQALTKGAVFGGAEVFFHKALHRVDFLNEGARDVLSGGLAGFAQGLALSPLLLLKTRVMTDPVFRQAIGTPMQQIVQGTKLGARVLTQGEIMKGSIVFASKRFADWTTRYFFARESERVFYSGRKDLSSAEKIGAGLMGGALSTLVTIPLDVIVAQVQDKKRAGEKVGFAASFSKNLKTGQLFAGLVPRILHVGKCGNRVLKKRCDRAHWQKGSATWVYNDTRRFVHLFTFFAYFHLV
jgi:hypothetical protein